MILDDGGDATMLVHHGLRRRERRVAFLDKPGSGRRGSFLSRLIKRLLKEKPKGWFAEIAKKYQGRLGRDHHRRASSV